MVDRKINLSKYITVGIITILIFCLGVTLGLIIENYRVKYIEKENNGQEINYQSLQLQYLYLSGIENSTESCPILQAALDDSISELAVSLDLLQKYEKDTKINKNEFTLLERKYLLDNLRYWIFSQRIKEKCNSDVINILYFYSLKDCSICPNQGQILTYFKKKLEDKLLVFPINTDLSQEKFIKILKLRYNFTELPTIIVNNDKYSGVVSRDDLSKIICEQSQNKERCFV